MATPPRLLGISGSIRKGSTSTIILQSLAEKLGGRATLDVFPLNDIPLYNADLDGETLPPAVAALKRAIVEHDGLVVCSPEYNYGISGVLKNALDWASRPGYKSPLKDKPCLIMTSSPGATGGVRAQLQVRETLTATLSRVVVRPQVVIASVTQKIENGKLTDEPTLKFALEAIDDLVREIRMVGASEAA
jgi:chromate reductase